MRQGPFEDGVFFRQGLWAFRFRRVIGPGSLGGVLGSIFTVYDHRVEAADNVLPTLPKAAACSLHGPREESGHAAKLDAVRGLVQEAWLLKLFNTNGHITRALKYALPSYWRQAGRLSLGIARL